MTPFLSRKILTLPAAVMKNIRLRILAIIGSMLMTSVNQRINRLPPPTPNPARNPRMIPIVTAIGILVNIDFLHLPKGSAHPISGAGILPEFDFLIFRQGPHLKRFPADKAMLRSVASHFCHTGTPVKLCKSVE